MHRCLERLQRVIENTPSLSSRYTPSSDPEGYGSLSITDRLFGGRTYIAEVIPPCWIPIAVRITPSMIHVEDESVLNRVYEYIFEIATEYGLATWFDEMNKRISVGVRISCAGGYTELERDFFLNLDDMRSFFDDNYNELRDFLRGNDIFF